MSTEEWAVGYDEGYMKGWNDAMDEKPEQPHEQEPVAEITVKSGHWVDTTGFAAVETLPDGFQIELA